MGECIVPGCGREAPNNLGVRLRRPDTTAIWAPNTEAYVCDHHAMAGARLTLLFEPDSGGEVEVSVLGTTAAVTRVTPIRERDESLAEALTDRLQS
jgi:hypothetical protein